jgi:hypothetical protein
MRRKEIKVAHCTLLSVKRAFRAEDDGIGCRLHLLNIKPSPCRNAKASALPWCVEGDAVVSAEGVPCFIEKETGVFGFRSVLFDECTIVSLGNETDFLTFFELVGWKTQRLSLSPDVGFDQVTQREKESGQPMSVEAIEEVGLIFPFVHGSRKDRIAPIHLETCIVSGRYISESSRGRKIHETPNFHSLVATDTGIGSCACEIIVEKIVDDPFPKGISGIDHFVRDVEQFGDVLRDADLATPPLLPLFGD